jgi:hypothetical protein
MPNIEQHEEKLRERARSVRRLRSFFIGIVSVIRLEEAAA